MGYIQVTSGLVVERLSVVARRIDVTVTLARVSDAQATWLLRDLQSTEGKDAHQSSLLVDRQLAGPDRFHWKAEDKNVRGNSESRIGIPVLGQADACRMH